MVVTKWINAYVSWVPIFKTRAISLYSDEYRTLISRAEQPVLC